jgi:hypothetical protein
VDAEGELPSVLPEESHHPPMRKPAVERGRRDHHVVAVLTRVQGELLVAQVPVGGPVEVGIVQYERRMWWRHPRWLRGAQALQEADERQQRQAATGGEALAQRLALRQLRGRGGEQLVGVVGVSRHPHGRAADARERELPGCQRLRGQWAAAAIGEARAPQRRRERLVRGEGNLGVYVPTGPLLAQRIARRIAQLPAQLLAHGVQAGQAGRRVRGRVRADRQEAVELRPAVAALEADRVGLFERREQPPSRAALSRREDADASSPRIRSRCRRRRR